MRRPTPPEALDASLAIESTAPRPFPFGLGWHPFFPRDDATRLGFGATAVWETDDTRLPTRHVAADGPWRFDPSRTISDVTLDHVFTGWDGRASLGRRRQGLAVSIEADTALACLVVYVPAGRDFLAVEPVTHITDAFNRMARGEPGTGTRTLDPGAAYSCRMRVTCARMSATSIP